MNTDKWLTIDHPSTVGVSVRGVVDGTFAQLSCLLHRHIVLVHTVQYSIRIGGARPDTEDVVSQSSTVRVDIVQSGSL